MTRLTNILQITYHTRHVHCPDKCNYSRFEYHDAGRGRLV